MRKLFFNLFLIVFTVSFTFGYFDYAYADNHATPSPYQSWKDSEKAIKDTNEEMKELEKTIIAWETEHSTLMGDAPTTALGMIGTGIMQIVTFWDSWKGIRLRLLDTLRIGGYIQMDIINHELVQLDAKRDIAYEAYKLTTSQPELQEHEPYYLEVPEVQAPCANICGTYFSSDVVGLSNLAEAISFRHIEVCPDATATPAGCGDAYWECNGRMESETQEHKAKICMLHIYYKEAVYNQYTGKFQVKWVDKGLCAARYRECQELKKVHRKPYNSSGVETLHSENSDDPIDNTPYCDECTEWCSLCPMLGACGHIYSFTSKDRHIWGTFPCGDATHVGYQCRAGEHDIPNVGACGHTVYGCGAGNHFKEQCSTTNSNGDRCTYEFWRCKHPDVPSYGPSHTHAYPESPETPDESDTTTCKHGHTYDPENTSQVNLHKTRTCRYRDCGNTWEKCVSLTPNCSSPRRPNKKCWTR